MLLLSYTAQLNYWVSSSRCAQLYSWKKVSVYMYMLHCHFCQNILLMGIQFSSYTMLAMTIGGFTPACQQ